MKTFEEIRGKIISDISTSEMMGADKQYSFGKIEQLAAKEYAKQYLQDVATKLEPYDFANDSLSQIAYRLMDEIDAQ